MSENKPSTLYMGLLLSAMVIVGFTMIQADLFTEYGQTAENLSYLDVSNEVTEQAEDLKTSMEREITGIEPLDTFIAGTYNAIKIIFGAGDLYTTFISDVAIALKIPGVFVGIAIAAVFTSIVIAIISIITKKDV